MARPPAAAPAAPADRLPRPRLIIVSGLPGSGKTMHAKQIERELRAIRFCPDEWMDALGINLTLGHKVVIEWGTWARSERDRLRNRARTLGAEVELHFLDEPVDVLLERIRRRNRESPPVQLDDLTKWAEIFERPSPEEMALFDSPPNHY